ncbi:MAG TPA: hypothetical protein VML55_00910 [Planctomycetaceae bacterium]|nr:hypothetical protein [Planctomycetaceae bacterium]
MARQVDGVAERRWRERLRRYRVSELTVAEFCEREDVSTASFYSWKRRLARCGAGGSNSGRPGQAGRTETGPLFVPVTVRPVAGVRIELPGGAVVELPRDADERLVRTCLRAAAELGREPEGEPC